MRERAIPALPLLTHVVLFLLLPDPTLQVDVMFFRFMNMLHRCDNLPPGVCCRPPIIPGEYAPGAPTPPSDIVFKDLLPYDIASGWKRRGDVHGCSGVPYATKLGPGSVRIKAWEPLRPQPVDNYFTGASYISIPAGTPPPPGTKAPWLQAEGILGLVWGGGEWFADTAKLLGVPGATKRRKRGMVSTLEGTAYCEAPRSWRYPTSITVNETVYLSSNTSELEYTSADGTRLDLENANGQ